MRRFSASLGLASVTQYLIVANVLVYALQLLNQPPVSGGGLFSALSLRATSWVEETFALITPPWLPEFQVWQLLTYMFLHGSLFHILINMFVLWQFGNILERVWGSQRFLKYYFFTGTGAGLVTVLWPFIMGGGVAINLGASGAIMGVLFAFAMLFPNQQLMLLFPPIPIRAKYMVIVIAGISILAQFSGAFPSIGHVTHLGGLALGLLYFKGPVQIRRLLS
ncbi:MAG: rhomboid family intramembrane serine protease [Candidatus Bipolaricaulia bacterium]